ncbi:GntR family transcriptional regulator [Alteromonadaceae bacterium M269]|nr:GntR family transcriptional regulator [Alteromonadaceae bacterium M269]
MEIVIDVEDPTPLFSQLIQQVKQAVVSNLIQPGEALPSIRQLASDLELNNKTVAKAYRLLERDAIIQTKGYRGTYVHPDAKKNCTFDLGALVTQTLNTAISELRNAGATDSELRIAFAQLINEK